MNERIRKHRESLRAAGLRKIELWVPDTRSKKFAAEARRQSRLTAKDPQEKEINDWLLKAQDFSGWR